jgi:acylphosphatase
MATVEGTINGVPFRATLEPAAKINDDLFFFGTDK